MIISHLKSFAKTPRLVQIVGIAKGAYMEQFEAKDISDIQRVTVQQISALSKTISGRVDLAEKVVQLPEDKVAQYMSIINTGQLPPAMQSHDPVMNIKAENEDLAKGKKVQVLMTENHANHIKEHRILVENPVQKTNAVLVQTTIEHIQEHLNVWRQTDPAILMITGQEMPPPPLPLPGQVPPQPGGQAPQGGQPTGPTNQAGPEEAKLPGLPGLPPGTDPNSEAAYDKQKTNLGGE